MTALVRIALQRPYTFVVLALVILIVGPLAAMRTAVDIFPEIRIPVIAVIWQYTGLPPEQMSGRITTQFQRVLTTTVNDIEHMEATSYNGFGIIKVFFQQGADIRIANTQVTAVSQTLLRQVAAGADRPRFDGDAGARPVWPGRRRRAREPESDHAGRDAEDRGLRIRDPAQQCPVRD